MKAATVNELKKELVELEPARVTELCLRLARFKKENKELLTFLIYESHDIPAYVREVKKDMDTEFAEMNRDNLYLTKKSLRKIIRTTNKYIRYIGNKEAEAELLIWFIVNIKKAKIPVSSSVRITNLYQNQLKKIEKTISELEEDLQYDYRKELKEWTIEI
jgi:hypothetical protein